MRFLWFYTLVYVTQNFCAIILGTIFNNRIINFLQKKNDLTNKKTYIFFFATIWTLLQTNPFVSLSHNLKFCQNRVFENGLRKHTYVFFEMAEDTRILDDSLPFLHKNGDFIFFAFYSCQNQRADCFTESLNYCSVQCLPGAGRWLSHSLIRLVYWPTNIQNAFAKKLYSHRLIWPSEFNLYNE